MTPPDLSPVYNGTSFLPVTPAPIHPVDAEFRDSWSVGRLPVLVRPSFPKMEKPCLGIHSLLFAMHRRFAGGAGSRFLYAPCDI
jgi:hypothetical protein